MIQRCTKQRKAILSYLQSIKSHPVAEEIHNKIIEDMPNISLGTIYRNLQILLDNNEIIRLEINGEYHFDACLKSHQHCICKKCKKIIDIFDKSIEKKIIKSMTSKGFTPERTTIYVTGICFSCQQKETH